MISTRFAEQLQAFASYPCLQERITAVLRGLPQEVQLDFINDPTFCINLEDYTPGQGWRLFMACPTNSGMVIRCVVLRRKLDEAPEQFAKYIIAHEFAHAYLRNGGWGEISDIEEAADALAAKWGYAPPANSPFRPPQLSKKINLH